MPLGLHGSLGHGQHSAVRIIWQYEALLLFYTLTHAGFLKQNFRSICRLISRGRAFYKAGKPLYRAQVVIEDIFCKAFSYIEPKTHVLTYDKYVMFSCSMTNCSIISCSITQSAEAQSAEAQSAEAQSAEAQSAEAQSA